MDGVFLAGVAFTVAGLVGYTAGVLVPYPGRSFALTGIMVGVTLIAVGRGTDQ